MSIRVETNKDKTLSYIVDVSKTVKGKRQRVRKYADSKTKAEQIERFIASCFDQGMTATEINTYYDKGETTVKRKTLQDLFILTVSNRWTNESGKVSSQEKNGRMVVSAMGKDFLLSNVDKESILDMLDYWKEQGNSSATRNRKLSAIMTMLDVAIDYNLIQESQKPRIKKLPENEGNPCWLSQEQIELILNVTRKAGRKEHADVFEFGLNTGLRIGELLNIKVGDVIGNVLRVSLEDTDTKKHTRSLPLTDKAKEIVKKHSLDKQSTDKLFDIKYESCRRVWDSIVRKAMGWHKGDNYSIHVLRHTFASLALQNKVPLAVIQKWLGHKHIETTQRYAKLSASVLQESVIDIQNALQYKAA